MKCKKCESLGTILLRKKDYYCTYCFLNNTNHKFRSCIGKNKILSVDDKILICYSGGQGSTVLLDLIHSGLSIDSPKKLKVIPFILHLTGVPEMANDTDIVNSIIEICKNYNFNVYIAHVSDYLCENNRLQETWKDQDSNTVNKFNNMCKNMPSTTRNDFIGKVKRSLYIRYAKQLGCKFIFTGDTKKSLAINLLSNIAIGRGSQIGNDVGFSDNRDSEIKILRTMKDISKEELHHYIQIKGLKTVGESHADDNSLQSVIQKFVNDLQENFEATISTVCKTADKLGVQENVESDGKCQLCKNDLGRRDHKLTAFEATNYSRIVSLQPHQNGNVMFEHNKPVDLSIFPHIHKCLCYGCSRSCSEMSSSELLDHIQNLL